jgi:endonuclease-3
MPAGDLAALFSRRVEAVPSIPSAVERAIELAGKSGTVLITGSIYSAAEALAHLNVMRSNELLDRLESVHADGAYPGRDPATAGPPPPGSQEPFRVLISTILSQRTRDENTHAASEALFSRFGTPDELADAARSEVEALIRPAGFYRQKAGAIIEVSRQLRSRYDSKVPADLDALMSLPGVGRKTANCVLAYGFGKPAIAVDTHVHRISNLLGLVRTATPEDTELALSLIIPEKRWLDVNRLLVRHGQSVCRPSGPHCADCPISHLCDKGIYG